MSASTSTWRRGCELRWEPRALVARRGPGEMSGRRLPTSGLRRQTRTRGSRLGPRTWTSAWVTKACPLREIASGPRTSRR
eukprot:2159353-Alexandrium_andersonii.AAC.1